MTTWKKVISEKEFDQKKKALFKEGPQQIVVLEFLNDIYALDNRCPHQGYPLYEGSLNSDAVLTCHWHNWKFDLKTGRCVSEGDNVRTYPTKKEGGFIWVNLSVPSKQEMVGKILKGLKIAFDDRKYGRLSRELARLYYSGIDPTVAIQKSIEWSYEKLKEGMGDAYCAAADWLTIYAEQKGNFENQLICLMEAVDHISYEVLRREVEPYQEKEIQTIAERSFTQLEESLIQASFDHYYEGGKALVGLQKISLLIRALGEGVCQPLLYAWVRSLNHLTRLDLNPTFKEEERFLALHARNDNPKNLFNELLQKILKNILYFDLQYQFSFDKPVSQNRDLLDVSEPLVFAHAVYQACQKYPKFWPSGLKQLSYFVRLYEPFVDKNLNVSEWVVSDEKKFWKEAALEKMLDHGIAQPSSVGSLLATFIAVKGLKESVPQSLRTDLLSVLNRVLHTPLKEKHTRRKARQNIELVSKDFR